MHCFDVIFEFVANNNEKSKRIVRIQFLSEKTTHNKTNQNTINRMEQRQFTS